MIFSEDALEATLIHIPITACLLQDMDFFLYTHIIVLFFQGSDGFHAHKSTSLWTH